MSILPSQSSSNPRVELPLIEEITQSILSNLDRDSLLNSVITLLHQIFGFIQVNIYTTQGEVTSVLKKLGISQEGLEPETIHLVENDESPLGRCVSHQEVVTINDVEHQDSFAPAMFEKGIKSELVIPLLQGNSLLGVLELCAERENSFEPQAVSLFQLMAERVAIALRNATLFRSEQMKRLVAERMKDLNGPLSADISVEEIHDRLLDELESFLPWNAAAIWILEADNDEAGLGQPTGAYRLAAVRHKDGSSVDAFDELLQDPEASGKVITQYPWGSEAIRQKIGLVREKTADYEPLGALLGFDRSYSAVAAPLMIKNQLTGLIVCAGPLPYLYDEESVSILETFADYASIIIENARLYEAAHDQAWISTVILQVAEATQSITNLDELMEVIVNMLPELIGVEACSIFLWDPSTGTFFNKASHGFSAEQAARLKAWDASPDSITAFNELIESKNPVILDAEGVSTEIAGAIFPDYDLQTALLVLFPLFTQNVLCGAILVDFSNSDLDFDSPQETWDEKYGLIQGAARQAATAIENLQLVKAQGEEAYISVALLQVAQAVVSLKQLDEILATIVRITPILVGVKRCIIYLWDGKDKVFHQSQYYGFTKDELALMGRVIKANEFPLIDGVQTNDRIIYHVLGPETAPGQWSDVTANDLHMIEGSAADTEEVAISLDDRSVVGMKRLLIGLPLSVKSEILGVMLIEEEDLLRGSPSTHIRERRIEIAKGITQQAAIAIKNEQLQQEAVKSERMERELQLAREIQAAFLPKNLPEYAGWDIAVRWQPAREVGGDFYDFIPLEDGRLGFVIADVADKGMPAALFMTLIRTLIRAAANDESSPAAVLKQVNELLIPDAKQGVFVTVFYAVLSVDSGKMLYANAGHNPPIVKMQHSNELIELTRTTIALGIFDDIEVEEREVMLNPEDWVLFYTDGITEAFSLDGEMFGKDRLVRLFTDQEMTSSSKLLDLIHSKVNEFIQGAELSDDITMAAFHRQKQ